MNNHGEFDAIIVGLGIIGATTALELLDKGLSVLIIEQHSSFGLGSSGLNGNQLSYSYTDALASLDTLKTIPAILMNADLSSKLKNPLHLGFMYWVFQFVNQSKSINFQNNSKRIANLAQLSQEVMHEWDDKFAFQYAKRTAGKMYLYKDPVKFEYSKQKLTPSSVKKPISIEEAKKIEPFLESTHDIFCGAFYSENDEIANMSLFLEESCQLIAKHPRAKIIYNTKITSFEESSDRVTGVIDHNTKLYKARNIILCTGWETLLTSQTKSSVPIFPIAGYSLSYENPVESPKVSLTNMATKSLVCTCSDTLRVTGFMDFVLPDKHKPEEIQRRVKVLKQDFESTFQIPVISNKQPIPWHGYRPTTPYSYPVIQPANKKNLFINAGHGMLGWTLSTGSARALSQLILA